MQINITGHHIDITPALREATNTKFTRLQRHYDRITSISVTFGIEKLSQIAEATIQVPGESIHASSESDDIYSSIDTLVDKLDKQLKRHKEKENDHRE